MASQQPKQPTNQVYVDPNGSMYYYKQPTMDDLISEAQSRGQNPLAYVLGSYPQDAFKTAINPPVQQPTIPSYRPAQPIGMQGLFPNMSMPSATTMQPTQSFGAGRFLSPSLLSSLGTPANTTSNT